MEICLYGKELGINLVRDRPAKSVAAGVGPDPQSADADQDLFL